MASIGLRDLSHHTSRIVNRVRQGEVIEVTDHGKPILRLVPIKEGESVRDRLISEGRLRPALTTELPAEISFADEGPSPSEALADLRDEERY
ncbi:type II toxin-antitoxin system Phd/YefM family antitoxin [Streptomyces sp. NPDC059506]|uniref:type II toxin-antitoxin system Phd/YefM family antitoxin n=1 Tax=Streptomyces TaxID=1883 RepID=UPI000CBA8949|nr:type II toxin-antitoxin system prevent-host-death family antitoxin [Streptomyces sp. SCUT-3]PLW65320.1 prevent-host-death protein [Streptomyces sp. DJ]QMV23645.1 type II toxin-antitoxin system prevent-host-death family antitoxin [Streptomyces sp. SCUT-3]